MRWNNAGDPIIIVRGTDDVVGAYYNTCRHRGAPLVTQENGCARTLVCPYHAWTYKTDGTLIGVPERQDLGRELPSTILLRAVRNTGGPRHRNADVD